MMMAAAEEAVPGRAGAMEGREYVSLGERIATEDGFLRGHGTLVVDGRLVAAVCGFVLRVNKLVSVVPVSARYEGSVGDVVVGRVTAVADKRWRVDVNSRQDAVLHLSAIHLADGVQRRRTEADSLAMRAYFEESDIISAEVQSVHDGAMNIHARSIKYGRLGTGSFVSVPAVLVRRQKQHFHTLPCGVDVIFGNNGYIWIAGKKDDDDTPEVRRHMSRVRNSVLALSRAFVPVYAATVMDVYEESLKLGLSAAAMLDPDLLYRLTQPAARREEAG